jgi:HD-GYP domain-containing protein (c-di-GMP phosphodiesterase class II)
MVLLRNHKEKDEKYEKYLFKEDIKAIRIALIIGALIYSLFLVVDKFLDVANINIFIIIRLYLILPLALIGFGLSYHKSFYKIHQYMLTLLYVVAGIGIIIMLILDPSIFSYYGGLFLVFVYGYFLLRIKWEFVTIGSIAIMIVYFILAITHINSNLDNFLIYSIFYIGFNLIAILGSYTSSYYRKEHYRHELMLKGDNVILEKQIYDNLLDIENSNYITIYSLAKLAESRDLLTGNHIDRVGQLSLMLATSIDESIYLKNNHIKSVFIQSIELASTLHDIGKIGIPENILNKPSSLTKKEKEIMITHCSLGSTTLREIQNKYSKNNFINMGIDICESHHENWDGTGYPRKLKGIDIPFAARIVAVVDVYDALISERPYKKAWTVEKSIQEIISLSGSKFDKDIIDAFIKYCDSNILSK